MPHDDIQYPPGFGLKDLVAWGSAGLVVLDADTRTVIKAPFEEKSQPVIQRERDIYKRFTELGGHQGILSYHGDVDGGGIRLEYASNHDLQSFIQGKSVHWDVRLRWMIQLAEALAFVHNAGIIHGDLTTANILLTDGLHAKLADFAGSSIDLSPLQIAITVSHEYPGNLLSTQGDIFAFGSTMYEITTNKKPYADLSEGEIRARYQKQEFPDVTNQGGLGCIIRKCWEGGYSNSESLARDLRAIQDAPDNLHQGTFLLKVLIGIAAITLTGVVCSRSARTT